MFAAARDDDLRRFVAQPVFALEFIGNGLAQFRNAAGRSVFGEPVIQGFNSGVLDGFRRVEIRLASAKADDVLPVGLHLFGRRVNGQSERWRERGRAM